MKNHTPLFPGFHLPTLRRTPRSEQQVRIEKLAEIKRKSLSQLGDLLGKFILSKPLEQEGSGANSRRRIYSKENTFWAFFSQILDADGGCREVVRKIQAFAAMKSNTLPSSSTAAYCQARQKLMESGLDEILAGTSTHIQPKGDEDLFFGRRVVVVDGTGLSMPDTEENQKLWPQQSHQKDGCGFPQAALCACFCLHTGGLLSYELGNKKSHELPMLRKQWGTFNEGDIFLGDKGFCSYFDVSSFKDRGVDSVITLARRIPVKETEAIKVLGENDLLIHWKKPKRTKRSSYTELDHEALPEELLLRQIKVSVSEPGYRVSTFYIVTTLLDADKYPASDIAELYFKRWDVELYFRDIKTTMGMDILRCKIPSMVRKEIAMHFIVYNCIRCLIMEASTRHNTDVKRMSFKGSLQALRQWEPNINNAKNSKYELLRLIDILYEIISETLVPDRPGRSEPRVVKRRPKAYQLMTAPRAEMKETKHRGRDDAEAT
jgi:hypothetical protein